MKLLDIAELILKKSPFPELEVSADRGRRLLTRFGDNRITQNVDQENLTYAIRALERDHGGRVRTARIDGDDISEKGIAQALEKLKAIISVLPFGEAGGEVAGLVGEAQKYENVPSPSDVFSDDLSARAADAVAVAVNSAKKQQMTASGTYSVEIRETAFANSKGVRATQTLGDCEFAVTVDKGLGAGRGFSHTVRPTDLEVERAVRTAVELCARTQEPVSVDAGAYDIVLEPGAFAELLVFLGWIGLSGKAYREERSFCAGLLGKKFCDERVTIEDLPLHEKVGGAVFDGQGYPKRNVAFVEKGVLKEVALDVKTARLMERTPTGHSNSEPSSHDPVPWNLSFRWEGETATRDQMIKRVKRGIYVTQFHYTNVVDVMEGSLTGMTRNGTFLIEDGRITKPVKNLRFTQKLVPFLNSIECAEKERERVTAFFGGSSLCPAVLARGFHFSSTTDF